MSEFDKKTLLLATNNQNKIKEIRRMLGINKIQMTVLCGNDVGGIPEVEEDALTYAGNAIKKAVEIAKLKNCITLADDSGLEVYALGGVPGVFSARYAGHPTNDKANLDKLLAAMDGQVVRSARYVCVMAVATPDGVIGTSTGICEGSIIQEPRGSNGFGYDPVFISDSLAAENLTFAEVMEDIKNIISHRYRALSGILKQRLLEIR